MSEKKEDTVNMRRETTTLAEERVIEKVEETTALAVPNYSRLRAQIGNKFLTEQHLKSGKGLQLFIDSPATSIKLKSIYHRN